MTKKQNNSPSGDLVLPILPGRYRWQKTASGHRIFEDCRHRNTGGARVNIGHFTTRVLRHVLFGELLPEKWQSKAAFLKKLFREWSIPVKEE